MSLIKKRPEMSYIVMHSYLSSCITEFEKLNLVAPNERHESMLYAYKATLKILKEYCAE